MSWVIDKGKDAIDAVVDVVKGVWDAIGDLNEAVWDFVEESVRFVFRDIIAPILEPVFKLIGIEDETVYSNEIVVVPLLDLEAKYFKNILLTAIHERLDIAEQVRFAALTGQRATMRSYLNYGKNHYIDGIPTVTVSEYFSDEEVVKDVIETEVGETITLHSVAFSIPNIDLWCKYYLMNNNSYSIETNVFVWYYSNWKYGSAVLNGTGDAFIVSIFRDITTTVIVDDYTQVLMDGPTEYTDTWTRTTTQIDTGTPSEYSSSYVDTNYVRTPTSTGGPFQTTFVNVSTDVTPSVENDTFDTEVPIYGSGGYYGVVYALDSAPSTKVIWYYAAESGVYPELDNSLVGGGADNLDSLPIVALREEFVNVDDDKTSERYKTTKGILDILELVTLDDLLESLSDNPDIDLIQDAFLMFGLNLYTDDQHSLRYLFNFFLMLSVLPKYDKASFLALPAADQSNSNFVYKITEGRFNATITGNYIELTEINGYIGPIGSISTEFTILPNTEAVIEDVEERNDPTTQDPNNSLGLINSIFYIRTQLTENVYMEIEVSGLLLTTYILTVGTQVNVKVIELVDPVTGDDTAKANFLIPISYYLLRQMTPIQCEQVIYDSAHLVIYAEQVTELEYYQTEEFLQLVQVIIDIIAIVILIVSLGTASNVSQALWIIAKQLLVQYGLTAALKEVLSKDLSDGEKAVAFLLYLFAVSQGADFVGLEGTLLLADQILLIINAVSTFLQVDTAFRTQELIEENREFESLVTERNEELEAAEDLLTFDSGVDTFHLLNSRTVPVLDTSSTPAEFYTRSLLVNVAPIILSQPSTYVSTVLDLDNITPIYERPVDYDVQSELRLI